MILAITATDFEMAPFLRVAPDGCRSLVTGVGVLESGLRLSRYLEQHRRKFTMALHFGVAGAYLDRVDEEAPNLLDICIAEKEIYGDLGICFAHRIEELPEDLGLQKIFELDDALLRQGIAALEKHGFSWRRGNFVTVSCASGTRQRGELLCRKYDGLCENMEGAAIARVCLEYDLPLMEIRCISNFVVDRDLSGWRLVEAAKKAGEAAAVAGKACRYYSRQ